LAAATIPLVRQLPEQCASCGRQIATLETCVLPDGTEKRGVEVTFKESADGGIRCLECASKS
jgi:DNA-directed RNA polymerase subunit RPC12/RpoP